MANWCFMFPGTYKSGRSCSWWTRWMTLGHFASPLSYIRQWGHCRNRARFQKCHGKDAQFHHRESSNFKVSIYSQSSTLSAPSQGLGKEIENVSLAAACRKGSKWSVGMTQRMFRTLIISKVPCKKQFTPHAHKTMLLKTFEAITLCIMCIYGN